MSDNSYFTNYRVVILRDNLAMVIILEIDGMVCVAIILFGRNLHIDARLKL